MLPSDLNFDALCRDFLSSNWVFIESIQFYGHIVFEQGKRFNVQGKTFAFIIAL